MLPARPRAELHCLSDYQFEYESLLRRLEELDRENKELEDSLEMQTCTMRREIKTLRAENDRVL